MSNNEGTPLVTFPSVSTTPVTQPAAPVAAPAVQPVPVVAAPAAPVAAPATQPVATGAGLAPITNPTGVGFMPVLPPSAQPGILQPTTGQPGVATEQSRFALPPGVSCPGNYPARAKRWDFVATAKGEPMLSIVFELRVGEHPDTKEPVYVEFPREKRLFFGESTIDRSFESLGYMGWKGEDPSEFNDGKGFDLSQHEVHVTITLGKPFTDDKNRTWPPTPEIEWINPLGGIRGTKIDAQDLKEWGDSIAKLRRAAAAKKSGPSDAVKSVIAQNGQPSSSAKSDVPF